MISTTANTTFTWTPVADPNLTMLVFAVYVSDRSHLVICAVPACRGTATIPSTLTSHWAPGTLIQIQPGFAYATDVPPTGRVPPIKYFVATMSAYQAMAM
jgi:hypothetical protein